jgi:hypothetical protein
MSFLLRLELAIGFSQMFRLLHRIPIKWPAGLELNNYWLGILYFDMSDLPRATELRVPALLLLTGAIPLLLMFMLRTWAIKSYNVEIEDDYVGDIEFVWTWIKHLVRYKTYIQFLVFWCLLPILLLPLCLLMGWQVMWTAFFMHSLLLLLLGTCRYMGLKAKIVDATDRAKIMDTKWVGSKRVQREMDGGIVETKKIRRMLTEGRVIPWTKYVVKCIGKSNADRAYILSLGLPYLLTCPLLLLGHPCATFFALFVWVMSTFWAFRKVAFGAAHHTMKTWQMFMTDSEILSQVISAKMTGCLFLLCALFSPAAGSILLSLRCVYSEINAGTGAGIVLWCGYLMIPGGLLAFYWKACYCVRKEDSAIIRSHAYPTLCYCLLLIAGVLAVASPGLLVWGQDLLEGLMDLPFTGSMYCAEPIQGGCQDWAQSAYAMRCFDNKLCDVELNLRYELSAVTRGKLRAFRVLTGVPHPYIGGLYNGSGNPVQEVSKETLMEMGPDLRSWVQGRGRDWEEAGRLGYPYDYTPATLAKRRYGSGTSKEGEDFAEGSYVRLPPPQYVEPVVTTSGSNSSAPSSSPTSTPTKAIVCSANWDECTICLAGKSACCLSFFALSQDKCELCQVEQGCELYGYTYIPTAAPTYDPMHHWTREWRVARMGTLADTYYDYPLTHPLGEHLPDSGDHAHPGGAEQQRMEGCPANCSMTALDPLRFGKGAKVSSSLDGVKYLMERWALTSLGFGANLAMRHWPKRRLDMTGYYYDEYYEIVDTHLLNTQDRRRVPGYSFANQILPERHYHLQSYGQADGLGGLFMAAWAILLAPIVLIFPLLIYMAADATKAVVAKHQPKRYDPETAEEIFISHTEEYAEQLMHARAYHPPVVWEPYACGAMFGAGKKSEDLTPQEEDNAAAEGAEEEEEGEFGGGNDESYGQGGAVANDDGSEEEEEEAPVGGRKRKLCPRPFKRRKGWEKKQYEERKARRKSKKLARVREKRTQEGWLANRLLKLIGMNVYGCDGLHTSFGWDAAGGLFLIESFRRSAWCWQSLELGRRFALVLLITVASSPSPAVPGPGTPVNSITSTSPDKGGFVFSSWSARAQLVFAGMILVPFFLLTAVVHPYNDRRSQLLALVTQGINMVQVLVGLAITDGYVQVDSAWLEAPLGLALLIAVGVAGVLLGAEKHIKKVLLMRHNYYQLAASRFLFEHTKLGNKKLLEAWDRMVPCQTPGSTFPKPMVFVGHMDQLTELQGRADHVTVLSARGPYPERHTLLHAAVKHAQPDIVRWLLKVDGDLKMTQGCTTAERLMMARGFWLESLTEGERALELKRDKAKKRARLAREAGMTPEEFDEHFGAAEDSDSDAEEKEAPVQHFEGEIGGVSYKSTHFAFETTDSFVSTFDKSGVLFHISTQGGSRSYMNPHESCEVFARMSSIDDKGSTKDNKIYHGSPERFVSNTLPGGDGAARVGAFRVGDPWNRTMDEEGSWMSVDIGEGRMLIPKWYVIRHGFGDVGIRGEGRLRSWKLQASAENKMNRNIEDDEQEPDEPDPNSWVTLRTHTNDLSLSAGPYSTVDFDIKSSPPATEGAPKGVGFRHFRILQTGPNSSGTHHLMCSGIELYGEFRDGDRRAIEKKLRDRRHVNARKKEKEEKEAALAENLGTGLEWGRSEKAAGHKTLSDVKEDALSEGAMIEMARENAAKCVVVALYAQIAARGFKEVAAAAAAKAEFDAAPTPEQIAAKETMKLEARAVYTELADIVDGATRTPLDLAIKNLTTQWRRDRNKRIERMKRNPRLRAAEETMGKPASGGSETHGRAPMPTEIIRHGEDDHDRKKRAAFNDVDATRSVVEAFADWRAGTFVGMQRTKAKGMKGLLGGTELIPTSGLDLESEYPMSTNKGLDDTMVTVRALAPTLRTLVLLDLRGAGIGLTGGLLVAQLFGDAADAHQGVRDERKKVGFPIAIRKLDMRKNDIGQTVRRALAIALLRLGGLAVSREDYDRKPSKKDAPVASLGAKDEEGRTVCLSPLQELLLDQWCVGDKNDKETVLNLEGKELTKDDVLLVAAVLQTTSSLTAVNMSHNKIGYGDQHDCGQALGMLLQVLDFNHPCVHTLNLKGNLIKAEMLQVQLSVQLVLGHVGGMASTSIHTKLGRTAIKGREKAQLPPSYFLVYEQSTAQESLEARDQHEIDKRKVEVTLIDLLLCPYRKLIHAAVGCMPVVPSHHRADDDTAETDATDTAFDALASTSKAGAEALPENMRAKSGGRATTKALAKSRKETKGKSVGRRFKRRASFMMEDDGDETRTGTVDGGSVVGLGLSLTALDLSENTLQGDALRPIAQWIKHNSTMTSLDLSNNDFGSAFEAADGEATGEDIDAVFANGRPPSPQSAHEEFHSSKMSIGGRPASPTAVGAGEQLQFRLNCRKGVKEMLEAVTTSHALLSLGMGGTGLGGWKDKQLVRLMGSSMGKFHTLCELKLPSCSLSSNDLKVIATAVLWYGVSSINHLDLSNNVNMGVVINDKAGSGSDGTNPLIKDNEADEEVTKLTDKELTDEIDHHKSGLEVFAAAMNNMPRLHKLELRGCCLCGLISQDDHKAKRSAGKRKGGSQVGKVSGTYTLDGFEALCKALALNAEKSGSRDKDHGGVLVHGIEYLELSDNILCSGGIEMLVGEWLLPTCLAEGKKMKIMPKQVAVMAQNTMSQFFDHSTSTKVEAATPEGKSRRRRSMRLGSNAALNEGAVTATMGPPGKLTYLGLRRTAVCTAYKYAHEVEVREKATTVKEKLKRNMGMLATMRRMSRAFGFGAMGGKNGGGLDTQGLLDAVKQAAEVREEARVAKEEKDEQEKKQAEEDEKKSKTTSMKLKLLRAAGTGAKSALSSAFAMGAAEVKRREEEVKRLKRKKDRLKLTNFFFTKYDPDPIEHLCKAIRAGLRNSGACNNTSSQTIDS